MIRQVLQMNQITFKWAVVGAGPAGIAAVGKLLDKGIPPNQLLWVDPHFTVGDFGRYWSNVSSNTKVKLFHAFLKAVDAFNYAQAPDFQLNHLPPEDTCLLKHMVEPLQWITQHLIARVSAEKTMIHQLKVHPNCWALKSEGAVYYAEQVILAIGAEPDSLDYSSLPSIPFTTAIDKSRLSQAIHPNETIAVFGSSHSAIMIVNHLVDLGIKKIMNFYRSPCRYALDMGDWILFDNTGLKGHTAQWAKKHIDGVLPPNLERYYSNEANITRFLPECNKAIYAVGFTRRQHIHIADYEQAYYNPHVGIIAPGLFGLGIAYPEKKTDPFGQVEWQVGLWKFMNYLDKVLPIWLNYSS